MSTIEFRFLYVRLSIEYISWQHRPTTGYNLFSETSVELFHALFISIFVNFVQKFICSNAIHPELFRSAHFLKENDLTLTC